MPAPLAARMVSSMSLTRAASSASKLVTGLATCRSSGFPIFSTRCTAIAGGSLRRAAPERRPGRGHR